MLVLTRKPQERIHIGENITITVVRVQGNTVRIGIEAPKQIRVVRGEVAVKDAQAGGEFSLVSAETEVPEQDEAEGVAGLCRRGSAAVAVVPRRRPAGRCLDAGARGVSRSLALQPGLFIHHSSSCATAVSAVSIGPSLTSINTADTAVAHRE